MKLEHQVCSLALAQKLKELGVQQESYFVWLPYLEDDDSTRWELEKRVQGQYRPVAAFTVAELGELLPPVNVMGWIDTLRFEDHWQVTYLVSSKRNLVDGIKASTEADARAKMLIYLIENKLIELTR